MSPLEAADRLALHELAARYGNTLDDRDWARFETCFAADCVYELRGFGQLDQVINGSGALRQFMEQSAAHPVAHHVTNVEVFEAADQVRMLSKIVGTLAGGLAGSGDYHDVVVKLNGEWKIKQRLVTRRRPPR